MAQFQAIIDANTPTELPSYSAQDADAVYAYITSSNIDHVLERMKIVVHVDRAVYP